MVQRWLLTDGCLPVLIYDSLCGPQLSSFYLLNQFDWSFRRFALGHESLLSTPLDGFRANYAAAVYVSICIEHA